MQELVLRKLRDDAERLLAVPLSTIIRIRSSSLLFVWHSFFKDLGAAASLLGDARYLERALEGARYLCRGGWEECGLVEELHHAFVLNGLADFFWRAESQIPVEDAAEIRELAGRVGALLASDAIEHKWGEDIRKRNAWNHTVIGYSGLGIAGFLAEAHPDAAKWREQGLSALKRFFRDGITEAGMTREGLAYCGFVFRNLSVLLRVAKARGEFDYTSLQDNPYLERLKRIPSWYAVELFPGGRYLQNWNDSYWNPLPAVAGLLSVFREIAPEATAYVWNRLVGLEGDGSFGVDRSWRDSSIGESALYPPNLELAATFVPPKAFHCPDHGYFAASVGPRGRESVLTFGAGEYIGAIHDQADNNSFTLFLDGIPVVLDAGAFNVPEEGNASSSYGHAAVVVDGKGQLPCGHGYGCAGVITHTHVASDHVMVQGDAVEAYRVLDYNPMLRARRQCVLTSGEAPYLVVFDDVCKDAREHVYEVLLHTPNLRDPVIDIGAGAVRGQLEAEGRSATLVMRVVGPALEDISVAAFVNKGHPPFETHDLWKFKLTATAPVLATIIYLEQPGEDDLSWQLLEHEGGVKLELERGRLGIRDSFSYRADPPTVAGQAFARQTFAPRPAVRREDRNRPTALTRLREHADDAVKLAGYAAALAATDYPTASVGIIMGHDLYREIGLEFLRYFMMWGDLSPYDDVLDVGCGGGRMAAALGYYLDSSARYVGFDLSAKSIAWCREAIGKKWPNFSFDQYDIGNSSYNPDGPLSGENFRFPYLNGAFSFAIATSLFTHLTRMEVKHYLREIARVLRSGGRLLATAYMMTPASEQAARTNPRAVKFDHMFGENPVHQLDKPMAGVAQIESLFCADAHEAGLVVDRIAYGWWSGLKTSNSKQDIYVLRKP